MTSVTENEGERVKMKSQVIFKNLNYDSALTKEK